MAVNWFNILATQLVNLSSWYIFQVEYLARNPFLYKNFRPNIYLHVQYIVVLPLSGLLREITRTTTAEIYKILILTLIGQDIKGQKWVSSSLNFSGCCAEVVHSEYMIRLKHSAEMSGYKLFFFPGRAKGEKCRLAFAAAKIDYEDIRLPVEEWEKEKACK